MACNAEVFFAHRLPAAANFAVAAVGVAFDDLPAGVGINFRVEHQHVHVSAAGQRVVEAAGADVVCPAVAAYQPHAAPHQLIRNWKEVLRRGFSSFAASFLSSATLGAGRQFRIQATAALRGFPVQNRRREPVPVDAAGLCAIASCLSALNAHTQANSALSSNSELDQAGPLPSLLTVQGVVGRLPP
jgi:hypothetical protein